MTKKNNIELIESFLSSAKDKTLLVNGVSEEIYSFYNFVIKEFANKLDIKVINNINPDEIKDSNELFIHRKVNLLNLNKKNSILHLKICIWIMKKLKNIDKV